MTTPLLSVEGLRVTFPTEQGPVHAVNGVDLAMLRGEVLALVGESGSGKSTVARAILGLVTPTRGVIRFEGTALPRLGSRARRPFLRRIQMVFQDPDSSLNPRLPVGTSISEPLEVNERLDREERLARVASLMESVGLDATLGRRHPHELSGGQKQRVCIARALALRPDLLVCDEAVSALDVSVQAQILNLLSDLREEHALSYLFITHDLRVVSHFATRVAVMHRGAIVEEAETVELFRSPRDDYTRALLSAVPRVPVS